MRHTVIDPLHPSLFHEASAPRTDAPFAVSNGLNILLVLDLPPVVQHQYHSAVAAAHPNCQVRTVGRGGEGELITSADVLATFASHVSEEALRRAKRLKWIQSLGTGVDGFGDHKQMRPGVLLTNMRGVAAEAMSEAALCAMFALARALPRTVLDQREHRWSPRASRLLCGSVVGVAGIGAISTALAPRCEALGMSVVGLSSSPDRRVAGFARIEPISRLRETVGDLDFLVILTPYTPRTHGLVNAEVLAAMKPGSFLVNLARGAVVDEPALLKALDGPRLAGAALDVFVNEPLPPSHPLWSHEKVLVTPHQGGRHDGYDGKAMGILISNIALFLRGDIRGMPNVVHQP